MMTDFSKLPLKKNLQENMKSLGFQNLTPIQAHSLLPILEHKDLIAKAHTGSGKTLAFSLGILNKIDLKTFKPQALVLCPTRELVIQVSEEIRKLSRVFQNLKIVNLCGGFRIDKQIHSLKHGAHIIVGTPGRTLDILQRNELSLQALKTFVIDEADRILDMGFEKDLNKIVRFLPSKRQTLFFSATFQDNIISLSKHLQKNPNFVDTDLEVKKPEIKQVFIKCEPSDKIHTLKLLIQNQKIQSSIIFCNTKQQCQLVANKLMKEGYSAHALSSDLEQWQRTEVLTLFANKSISFLVATDVAARGLHIDKLSSVIIYDISKDLDFHIHRIGRTGRAGEAGRAYSFVTNSDLQAITMLENKMNLNITYTSYKNQNIEKNKIIPAPMSTFKILGGKKNKIRAGDILGALTSKPSLTGSDVGKISMNESCSYVAIIREKALSAKQILTTTPIKGRLFKIKHL